MFVWTALVNAWSRIAVPDHRPWALTNEAIFFAADDYARYCDWLTEAASNYGCAVHGTMLMTNHVHLLLTPLGPDRARCNRSAAAMCAT
jgi:REP element-mobilizing transposase RayT